jgi:hypothetical protein
MRSTVEEYCSVDDVWSKEFLNTILIFTAAETIENPVLEFLASQGCKTIYVVHASRSIVKGPFFYSARGLFWVWKLFPDTHEAFITSTIPSQTDRNL